jgi:hypothetical protein
LPAIQSPKAIRKAASTIEAGRTMCSSIMFPFVRGWASPGSLEGQRDENQVHVH